VAMGRLTRPMPVRSTPRRRTAMSAVDRDPGSCASRCSAPFDSAACFGDETTNTVVSYCDCSVRFEPLDSTRAGGPRTWTCDASSTHTPPSKSRSFLPFRSA
jgi:hypothetical protein